MSSGKHFHNVLCLSEAKGMDIIMKALLYMSKRKWINKLKQLKKKPVNLILSIVLVAYFIFLITVSVTALVKADFQTPYWLLAALTVWGLYNFFINFATYAKRKGVIFYPSHAHFIFTAPIRPKIILLYGAGYNFLMTLIVSMAFVLAAILGFHLPLWKIVSLFIVLAGVESVLEGSIIIVLYANERFSQKTTVMLARTIYVLLAGITLFGIWYFRTKGFSLESIINLIDFPGLQMLPIIGWNIAVFRLILLGPTMLNLVCSGLYLLTVIAMAVVAVKMKCNGGYYEDAAKFADDYAEMKARKNNGEMVMSIGKKKKFKRASVEYKASGAKAIFYRQLLEYKKEKWFIFSYMTLFCIGADILFLKVIDVSEFGSKSAVLLGIVAYLAILTGGYLGKWDKELKNPYLFLLPDSPAKKMWYATVMEHVKAAIDGAILVLPLGIAWKVHPLHMVSCWLIYVLLQAIKLYTKVLIDSFLRNSLGETVKQLVRLGVQGGIIGIGVLLAVVAVVLQNFNFAFFVILIYGMIMAVVIGLLTVSRFAIMEQYD